MQWQDIVLATCILGFNIALFPTIFSQYKPHAGTGIMTAFFQIVSFIVYSTLQLWYSAAMALLNATLWSIIVAQKITKMRRERKL